MFAGEKAKRGDERSSMPGFLPFLSSECPGPTAPTRRTATTAAVLYDTGHSFSVRRGGHPRLDQSSRPGDNPRMSLRLEPSVAVREGQLTRLLAERGLSAGDAGLARIVEDAELVGSLELAGLPVSWDDARAATPPPPLEALRGGRASVPAADRFPLAAVRAWHEALAGPVGFRRREAAGAPPEFIEDRLASL